MRARHPGAEPLLREWDALLDRPLEELLPVSSRFTTESRAWRGDL